MYMLCNNKGYICMASVIWMYVDVRLHISIYLSRPRQKQGSLYYGIWFTQIQYNSPLIPCWKSTLRSSTITTISCTDSWASNTSARDLTWHFCSHRAKNNLSLIHVGATWHWPRSSWRLWIREELGRTSKINIHVFLSNILASNWVLSPLRASGHSLSSEDELHSSSYHAYIA